MYHVVVKGYLMFIVVYSEAITEEKTEMGNGGSFGEYIMLKVIVSII